MENNILKFKTSINCENCLKSVRPVLNRMPGIESWEVDTQVPEKVLTVISSSIPAHEVIETVKLLGFEIEEM